MPTQHFLTGAELAAGDLARLLDRADALKRAPLDSRALQLTRGESVRDTAMVLSRNMAAIGLRTGSEETLAQLAAHATVPVFNMLSPLHHPCQALADLMTLREAYGELAGLKLAYIGDSTNVTRSLAVLAGIAGMQLSVASPPGYTLADQPGLESDAIVWHGGRAPWQTAALGAAQPTLCTDPIEAVAGAQAVYTDVWVSMGDEATAHQRRTALDSYRIDDAMLDAAAPGAFALHCLPAHPGEEITSEVLYGTRQRIWDQAENRRHAQKALLEWLLEATGNG